MSTAEPAVRTSDRADTAVPAPRRVPEPEQQRRHDGAYWDVDACAWRRWPV